MEADLCVETSLKYWVLLQKADSKRFLYEQNELSGGGAGTVVDCCRDFLL